VAKGDHFTVVEAAGLGLKIFTNHRNLEKLPPIGSEVKFFTYLYLREDGLELYGFATPEELKFFELLNSVVGVGPKSALAILSIAELKELTAAIKENRPDLLTRASGIGRKTAERIILELRNKIQAEKSGEVVVKMEADAAVIEVLVNLGYKKDEARNALMRVNEGVTNLEERLKATLKILGRKV